MLKIAELRRASGKRQKDVAQDLHLGRTTYNQYETGKRTPDHETLSKIADYFNVSVDYILGRNTPSNIETFDRTPAKVETFTRTPAKVETFDRKDAQKEEAPSDLFKETEEAYIKMLAEEEGTSIDSLHLSEERRRQLRRVILSLLKE